MLHLEELPMIDPKVILVIDDERLILELVKITFETKGYKVFTALDGKNGLEIARQKHIDLIILDLMMPEMDGFEVFQELQQNTDTKNIPIVVLTARSQRFDKEKAQELGISHYIVKPFEQAELEKTVEKLLQETAD